MKKEFVVLYSSEIKKGFHGGYIFNEYQIIISLSLRDRSIVKHHGMVDWIISVKYWEGIMKVQHFFSRFFQE